MLVASKASCSVANAFSTGLQLIWPRSGFKSTKMSRKRIFFLQKVPVVNGLISHKFKDDLKSAMRSLGTPMFMSLTWWNAIFNYFFNGSFDFLQLRSCFSEWHQTEQRRELHIHNSGQYKILRECTSCKSCAKFCVLCCLTWYKTKNVNT